MKSKRARLIALSTSFLLLIAHSPAYGKTPKPTIAQIEAAKKAEAEAAATLAIALLRGEEATTATGSVNNGTIDVPSVLLVPVGITKANVKDVIADGFQTREAVCADIEDLCTANGL